ncbi:aldehyde dehydrogenase family protein [Actinomadura viridis]|uniref:aldehyde dehydrogenase family protein n=1 Tax=Actinomadura viridis TaxID=58110 RepID=UPI00369F528F
MAEPYAMFIDGSPADAASGATYKTFEPATRRHLVDIASGGPEDVDRAVAAARAAFDSGPWPRLPPSERAEVLRRAARRLEAERERLAELEARDNGATIRKARDADVGAARAAFLRAAWQAERLPDQVPGPGGTVLRRPPLGVVAAIVPWNFPLALAAARLAPAIAAGNACVVKPASFASVTVIELVRLLAACGLPPGVANVVTGPGAAVGGALARHPGVDLTVFTGSDDVGEDVAREAAAGGAPVRLNLGGKSPNVVLADADLDAAADGVLWGAFFHNGQICMAGTRAVVDRAVHDAFTERLVERARALRLGDPLDPGTDLGPLVSRQGARRTRRYVDLAVAEGARVACGGSGPAPDDLPAGLDHKAYFRPTVLTGVGPGDTIAREEVFGPALAVIEAGGADDAVAIANDSRYGLSAGVWSGDPARARATAARLRAERVWINEYPIVDLAPPSGAAGAWDVHTNELDEYRARRIVSECPGGGTAAPYHVLVR